MGTLQFSPAITALGREAVIHLPAVVNPTAVTVAEATAAGTIHLTCNIRTFNPSGEQQKTKKYRHCSKQAFDVLGRTDWSIERLRFIDDPQALDSSTAYPHKALTPGTKGFILRRRGLDTDPGNFVALAAAQRYQLFTVEYGDIFEVPVNAEEEGQEFEYEQEVAVKGVVVRGALVTGA